MSQKRPKPLTLENGLEALRAQGCGPTLDRTSYLCPCCKSGELTISANGHGPEFTCSDGCDCAGALVVLANITPRGDHIDQLAKLRDDLKLPELERVVKDGRRGDHYALHLNDGRVIALGSIAVLTSQAKFRNAWLPQLRRNPPRFKAANWDDVVERIEQAAEERDTVATAEEEAAAWIGEWLRRSSVPTADLGDSQQLYDLLANPPRAFVTPDGRLCLRLPDFLLWISQRTPERITTREMSTRLASLGFTKPADGGQLTARRGDEIRKARYWISPVGFEATR